MYMYKVFFEFTKKDKIRYISHLDLMRLFMRAFRRADLPVKMSQGFSPHPKFSIKRALKLGVESEAEQATVLLKEPCQPDCFRDKLQVVLPPGIKIKNVTIEMKEKI